MITIKDKKVYILRDSKYDLGKNKKEIKENLILQGAKIVSDNSKSDYVILGRKNKSLHFLNKNDNILVETELIGKRHENLDYFEGLEQKLYDMIRRLIAMDNITVDLFEIGKGIEEEEMEKIEKKLKKPIPKSVKEFYRVFGYVKVLWSFKNPPVSYRKIYSNSWYLHSGQHNGCINILPIKKFLFEDWKNPELYLSIPDDKDIRMFDLYSDFHILACELSDAEDPVVYLGSDHGVSFESLNNLTFSNYVKTIIGIYCYLNRFTNTNKWIVGGHGYIFDESHVEDIEDKLNKTKSIEGFVDLDNSNAEEIEKFKIRSWEIINSFLDQKEYKKASDKARILSKYDLNAYSIMLDVFVIEENEEMFFKGIEAFSKRGFDIEKYESGTKQRNYLNTSKYAALKKTLSSKK